MRIGLPLIKNILTPLAKNVLIPFRLKQEAPAKDAAMKKNI